MSIYLDWNATTPLRQSALDAWVRTQTNDWGNASSIHTYGQSSRHHWDAAKARVAQHLGCRASSVVFTASGTEANNLAIHSACVEKPAGKILASAIDHSSILRPAAAQTTHQFITLHVNEDGQIIDEMLASSLDESVHLVCLQYANNELGTRQNIPQLVSIIRERAPQALIHCDACQGGGKSFIHAQDLGVDFLSISAHKFGGPKGVGALLFLRPGPIPSPLIHGGQQQQDRRSGSEDVAGAAALAAALEEAHDDLEHECRRQEQLLEACFTLIQNALPEARWIGHHAPRMSNTLSLAHPGLKSDPLVMRLDMAGIAVSRGSACMAARKEPSHVIRSLGISEELASSVIRVSIGHTTTAEECEQFAFAYVETAKAMIK